MHPQIDCVHWTELCRGADSPLPPTLKIWIDMYWERSKNMCVNVGKSGQDFGSFSGQTEKERPVLCFLHSYAQYDLENGFLLPMKNFNTHLGGKRWQ
jgi:hypothetical protein